MCCYASAEYFTGITKNILVIEPLKVVALTFLLTLILAQPAQPAARSTHIVSTGKVRDTLWPKIK